MLAKRKSSGFTLIELVVVLAIFGALMAIGVPQFGIWIQNSKIRTAGHAIQDGLQLARAEAVRRNTVIRFQLTTSIDSGCALSTVDVNWVVSLDDPTGACDTSINDAFTISDAVNNPAPRVIQKRAASEGSSRVVANSNLTFVAFNGLGRLSGAAPTDLSIDVSPSTGTARDLRVTVTAGGQIRMCDPALPTGDPQRC